MSKYDKFCQYLLGSGMSEIKITFTEIETILGFSLPRSAYTYPMWWANYGHSQASSWTGAGYMVKHVDLKIKTILFTKSGQLPTSMPRTKPQPLSSTNRTSAVPENSSNAITVCGYTFHFLQNLLPVCENGKAKEFFPEKSYQNRDHLPLLANGHGPFCRFSIDASAVPGVYLWVADGEIIYIGETINLQQRFNVGYGNISPRNCYLGGQSTNCKMNKVVLKYYKAGKTISLYFLQTNANKEIELALLNQITTRYNVKDN